MTFKLKGLFIELPSRKEELYLYNVTSISTFSPFYAVCSHYRLCSVTLVPARDETENAHLAWPVLWPFLRLDLQRRCDRSVGRGRVLQKRLCRKCLKNQVSADCVSESDAFSALWSRPSAEKCSWASHAFTPRATQSIQSREIHQFQIGLSSQGNSAETSRVGQENLAPEFVFVTIRFQLAGCPSSMFPKSISFLFIITLTAKWKIGAKFILVSCSSAQEEQILKSFHFCLYW